MPLVVMWTELKGSCPAVPVLFLISLLTGTLGSADLKVNKSETTPGASRNRPHGAHCASRSSGYGVGARERYSKQQDFCQ